MKLYIRSVVDLIIICDEYKCVSCFSVLKYPQEYFITFKLEFEQILL